MTEIILQKETPEKCTVHFFTSKEAAKKGMGKLFEGNYLESRIICGEQGKDFCVYVGLGDGFLDINGIKNVCAKAIKEAGTYAEKIWIPMDELREQVGNTYGETELIGAAAEGILLASHRPFLYKSEQKKEINISVILCGISPSLENQSKLMQKRALARGICFARDAVGRPSNLLCPEDFAKEIKSLFQRLPVEVEIYDAGKLAGMGMEALLTVGKGSKFPPCLVVIRYLPEKNGEITALVGKGVTVDTGGYCIKSAGSMAGIKGDMAGAAGVVATMYALARSGGHRNTVAVLPMCENRISPDAMLPGDIISSFGGKTIEILNTDAEGRLILADGVSYAVRKEGAARVLDIATLTGAAAVTFGKCMAPVMADDESFYREFARAAEKSGEHYVRIPFFKEHEKMIESSLADVKNVGGETCGSITAGLFIRMFAEGRPWVHLDIAGTAETGRDPVWEYYTMGGTGAGASTMFELCF